jgi:hypothetical protein
VASREKDPLALFPARGVRKFSGEVTRAVKGAANQKLARRAVSDLTSVVAEVQDRLRHGPEKRSAAAKKAARTRKRKTQARSVAAKRASRTRARA